MFVVLFSDFCHFFAIFTFLPANEAIQTIPIILYTHTKQQSQIIQIYYKIANHPLRTMQNLSTLDQAITAMQSLIKKSKPSTSTTMKSAIAALYTADAIGQLRYSGCIGLLELDSDRQLKTFMLRFYNMETVSLVFEVELYYGFYENYKMITSTFYIFQYMQGIVGLLFRNQTDAQIMSVKIKSNSPKLTQFDQIKKKRIQQAKQKKQQGSFFNKVKGFFSDKQQEPKKHSGQVIAFEKGISFDIKTGRFNTDKIPAQWQEIFDSLQLSQEDLNNKEITNIIVQETILQQVKTQAYKNQDQNLQAKIKQVQQQQKQYMEAYRQTVRMNLPPPPPPPPTILLGPPPQLADNRASFATKRGNLMQQIRNNKIQLNHVSKISDGVNLDISNMNKEERNDHVERLRMKLQMRKKALNRREASDDEDQE